MEKIVVSHTVNAPIEDVWASWDDFGNIYKFNPNVSASRLLSDGKAPTGKGTRRECELNDGKNFLREKIVDYVPLKKMKVEIYETSMPVKSMTGTFEFRRLGESRTEVTMTAEFEPKGGFIGKLMLPLMRRQFKPMLAGLLNANAAYVERGAAAAQAA